MQVLTIKNINEISSVAKKFLESIKTHKHLAFYGEMGVGKTTFIKELCKELGVDDTVNSPSFAIINEYFSETNGAIYHFDLYRIESEEEAYDFGYEDYFYGDDYCFVEWPERIENLIPEHFLIVKIVELENGTREISF
jgi:tRNA threonylcarbamoyladenosine biosynthesis protein TsaE